MERSNSTKIAKLIVTITTDDVPIFGINGLVYLQSFVSMLYCLGYFMLWKLPRFFKILFSRLT